MFELKKIMIGSKEVHIIGVQHGIGLFFGRRLLGLTEQEKNEIKGYLQENGFHEASSLGLLEGTSASTKKVWKGILDFKHRKFDGSIHIENKSTFGLTFKKDKQRKSNSLKRLTRPQQAAFFALFPLLVGAGLFIVAVPKFRKSIWQNYLNSQNEMFKQQQKNLVRRGDVVFRDFVQAAAVRFTASNLPVKRIFLFQGVSHTPITERFLADDSYYFKYARRVEKMAPRANKLLQEIKKQQQERIRAEQRRRARTVRSKK
jgi:hypothetical protein